MIARSARPVDPRHDLLVRAALSPGDAGEIAYRKWCEGVELFTLDHASITLLAPLAQRLEAYGDDPVGRQIAKIARMTWLRGNALLTHATVALAALTGRGIPTMLAKGAAVLHHSGLEIGRRPMNDIDVCVPIDELSAATLALVDAGFRSPLESLTANRPHAVADALHAVGFHNDRRAGIDLHWHLLATSLHSDAEHGFWAASSRGDWRGIPVGVTSREDTALHVIVHGAQFKPDFALRWTTDVALLCATGPLRWDALSARAREHRAAATVADALTYLGEVGALEAPAEILAELRADRSSRTTQALRRLAHARRGPGPGARALLRDLEVTVGPGDDAGPRDVTRILAARARALRGAPPAALPALTLGEQLSCRLQPDGHGARHLVAGWHYPEPHGTWSRDARVRIVLPLAEPRDDALLLEAELLAFVSPWRPRMDVDVRASGRRVARWSFHGLAPLAERRAVWLTPQPGRTVVDLVLQIRHPRTGEEVVATAEERALGISMDWIRLRSAHGERTIVR